MTCPSGCRLRIPSQVHCSGCHRTFGSIGGFDRHRRDGRCVDPAGLAMHTDHRGVWRFDGTAPHADAPSAPRSGPQTAETPRPGVTGCTDPAQTNLEGHA